ncbi:MAG TPA: hypothetical protein VGP13_03810 [Candidatus Paceibacterota bacterium]|jgi:hypothetical protein|nr:hypothetical protein [Candidatus Paceibacterota bacterium]
MKKYVDHIIAKEPHERRRHAMQLAGILTAMVFVVWITTLGLRIGGGDNTVAQDDSNQTSLSAAAAQSINGGQNTLYVASTTQF